MRCILTDEKRIVADHFSKSEIVREMHDRNKIGLNPWEQQVVNKYFKQHECYILDIGCGTGRETFALADMGFKVLGVDISQVEIDIAISEAKACKVDVVFEIVSGMKLKYPEETFDYIIMWAQAFGNVYGARNQISLLKECYRTVKSAGCLCFSGHNNDYVKFEFPQYTDGKKFFAYSNTKCYWELFTIDEMRALATEAGFKIVDCCNSIKLGSPIKDQVLVCLTQKPEQIPA